MVLLYFLYFFRQLSIGSIGEENQNSISMKTSRTLNGLNTKSDEVRFSNGLLGREKKVTKSWHLKRKKTQCVIKENKAMQS